MLKIGLPNQTSKIWHFLLISWDWVHIFLNRFFRWNCDSDLQNILNSQFFICFTFPHQCFRTWASVLGAFMLISSQVYVKLYKKMLLWHFLLIWKYATPFLNSKITKRIKQADIFKQCYRRLRTNMKSTVWIEIAITHSYLFTMS